MVAGPDVPQHVVGGPDEPGCPVPGQHGVPAALPPVAVSSADVWPCTELLGLPAQRLCQENPLPLQVSSFLFTFRSFDNFDQVVSLYQCAIMHSI